MIKRSATYRRTEFDRELGLLAVLVFLSQPLRKEVHLPHFFGRDCRDTGECVGLNGDACGPIN